MKKLSILWVLVIILFVNFGAIAQGGTIRGFVYDEASAEPIIFTNVFIENTNLGAATDLNGYFVITNVPKGEYIIRVTSIGYDSLRVPVEIKGSGHVVDKRLYITEAVFALEGVMISAERGEAKTETRTSVVKISPKQISKLPSVGGQPDLAQYLQVVPGVIFTGDQGGQLYIRGGSPVQNKVLLDGMTIYNPFHSIGLFSVFETDIIRNADVYTGGFGAEYGGRISSIMDIRTKEGNKRNFKGKISGSTFGANMLLEGPIIKQKETGGSSSFLLTAKNSYLEQTADLLYNYGSLKESGLPFNYTDVYGKLTFAGSNGSKANVFGFSFNDQVNNFQALDNYQWNSIGGGMNFIVIPGISPALLEGGITASRYAISMNNETMLAPKTSTISGFDVNLKFTYFFGKHSFKYGFNISATSTEYFFKNNMDLNIEAEDYSTDVSAFAKGKVVLGDLLLEPSLRLQYYSSIAKFSPEPRLALKYNISDRFRFKMAAGMYSQNLISVRSDRDIVNLFFGYLSSAENIPEYYRDERVKHSMQTAEHLIAGFEIDVTNQVALNIEGYFKNFSQLTSLNRNKIYENQQDNPDAPDYLVLDFLIEKGKAYGVDLSVKYNPGRLYLWAVYSLGNVTRTDEFNEYHPHFDRRHNVNIVTSYQAGSKRDWELSARWNLGSGFPYTLVQGFAGTLPFGDGVNTDYTTANETMTLLYGEYNGARLPYYHRLDLNVKKTFTFSNKSTIETDFSVTNTYDRQNIFYQNRITGEKVYQLPLMPSLGITYRF